jgi:hypothetical protein
MRSILTAKPQNNQKDGVMKKLISLSLLIFCLALISFFSFFSSFAQGMTGNKMGGNNTIAQNDDEHTAREEAEGKVIWEKLRTKEINCQDLSSGDFGALGEYFMGLMVGEQHEAMNNMMIRMMGKEGEEEMHVAMGKRLSARRLVSRSCQCIQTSVQVRELM